MSKRLKSKPRNARYFNKNHIFLVLFHFVLYMLGASGVLQDPVHSCTWQLCPHERTFSFFIDMHKKTHHNPHILRFFQVNQSKRKVDDSSSLHAMRNPAGHLPQQGSAAKKQQILQRANARAASIDVTETLETCDPLDNQPGSSMTVHFFIHLCTKQKHMFVVIFEVLLRTQDNVSNLILYERIKKSIPMPTWLDIDTVHLF